jgi:hypothetical protein
MALLTSTRPSANAPGEIVSRAARIATNAEPQSITVTNPASRAAISDRGAVEDKDLLISDIVTTPKACFPSL